VSVKSRSIIANFAILLRLDRCSVRRYSAESKNFHLISGFNAHWDAGFQYQSAFSASKSDHPGQLPPTPSSHSNQGFLRSCFHTRMKKLWSDLIGIGVFSQPLRVWNPGLKVEFFLIYGIRLSKVLMLQIGWNCVIFLQHCWHQAILEMRNPKDVYCLQVIRLGIGCSIITYLVFPGSQQLSIRYCTTQPEQAFQLIVRPAEQWLRLTEKPAASRQIDPRTRLPCPHDLFVAKEKWTANCTPNSREYTKTNTVECSILRIYVSL